MPRSSFKLTFPPSLFVFCGMILILTQPLFAQAVSDPNQIVGNVRFTNTNPDIISVLQTEGMWNGNVTARSTNFSPPLNHNSSILFNTGLEGSYEVTVESNPSGILYDLKASALLNLETSSTQQHFDSYLFSSDISSAVFPEPAPDIVANIEECVGLLDIRWVDQDGDPVAISGGSIQAYRLTNGERQATSIRLLRGTTQEYLAVRGDGTDYRIDIRFTRGEDPFSDQLVFLHESQVNVSCDQIVPIDCIIPEGGEGTGELGRIVGKVDMMREDEHPIEDLTLITAERGPFQNFRLDTLDFFPSEGDFELENLMPTDATSPEASYHVSATMAFRTGNRYQYFRSPALGIPPNDPIFVHSGETVDLGETLVFDPGYVHGDLFYLGPPETSTSGSSCIRDVVMAPDSNGDGIPNEVDLLASRVFRYSLVEAIGSARIAPGATMTANAGLARVLYPGSYNSASEAWEGDYELTLGGLHGESSYWTPDRLTIVESDVSPEADVYQNSLIHILDQEIDETLIVPQGRVQIDRRYCFSEVRITFRSTNGIFYRPQLQDSNGLYVGRDFEGENRDYEVFVQTAEGTPRERSNAGSTGRVNACLPQADYELRSFVTSINPNGTLSQTELPPIDVEIGCRQIIELTPELQIQIDEVPECSLDSILSVSGSVSSDVEVASISYSVNGGTSVAVCTSCGEDPVFAVSVPLESCDNVVVFEAIDEFDNRASIISFVDYDTSMPILEGCQDVSVELESGTAGIEIPFEVTATHECDGHLPVTCDFEPGAFFPVGVTVVSCTAESSCGQVGSCSFQVDVAECSPVDPDVKTQGFWKRQCTGPHPSGEHDLLPTYATCIGQTETFSGVVDEIGICTDIVPAPKNDKCEQAEAQLMALLLNTCSERIALCNCIIEPDLEVSTVRDAIDLIDGLLSNPGRTVEDCRLAQSVADRINNGVTLITCSDNIP